MFVDHIKVYVKAGDGGDGSVHFLRAKFQPKGGPDGGDGGRGGNIILRVDSHTASLKSFFYKPNIKAEHGAKGSGRNCTGRSGRDLVLPVPAGTLVFRSKEAPIAIGHAPPPDEMEDLAEEEELDEDADQARALQRGAGSGEELELVADLTKIGEEFILAKGGIGGKGNINFKTPTNRAPREHTLGTPGEEGIFYFELRRIADAGLVGFPNAGKSTILSCLSAARPKVAAYPFTTLQPMVGVIEYPNYERVSLADIPGLIEGAHANVGLGHDFLRHILRCRLLVFVADMAGSEGRDPWNDIAALRTEISLYDKMLSKQPWIVVANKMDLPGAEENLKIFKTKFPRVKTIPISALEQTDLEKLRDELRKRVAVKFEN